jgi:rod shape-determining protein MreC
MPPRRGGRSRFTLVVLVLTAVTLVTLDAQNVGPVERTKDALATVVAPVGDAVGWAASPVGDLVGRLTDADEKDAEIAELQARVAELEAQVIDNAGAAEELADLRAQLDIDQPVGVATAAASVVAGSVSNFDGLVLQIDKGLESGIRNGNSVIGPGGLIGVVEDARDGRSVVRLIDDTKFAISVRVLGSDEVALAYGQGAGEPLRLVDGIRATAAVEVGDLVVTAGGPASVHPSGLAVGTVTAVTVDEGELELELDIDPSGSYRDLTIVTVLLYDAATAPLPDPAATPGPGTPTPAAPAAGATEEPAG